MRWGRVLTTTPAAVGIGSTRSRTLAVCVHAVDQPVAFAVDLGRAADRLAVADARLVDLHVQLEVAQQAVLDHLQVQLAHAADERLARLFVLAGGERGVLLAEHLERVGQLLLVGRALRLDGHRDDRLGELDRLQQDRLAGVAERVAGDRVAQADDADDVAGLGADSSCSSFLLAWMCQSWATFSFLSLPGLSTRLLPSSVPE